MEDRDLAIQGAIYLAYGLLEVGAALGRDPIAEKQWELGTYIVVKVLQRKSRITSWVLNELNKRIIKSNNSTQYAGKISCHDFQMRGLLIKTCFRLFGCVMPENFLCHVEQQKVFS